jgi:hypothetical protein
MTRNGRSSSTEKSNSFTRFGWLSAAASRASRSKRATKRGSSARTSAMILIATARSSWTSVARQTTAIPPRPITSSSR